MIRSTDFANIRYPNLPDYSGSEKKRVTLKPGEATPSHLSYGDVTGDGEEDAIVVLPIENSGSAIPYYVYIFTMEKEHPKIMWGFETGDRADGGLRRVYAENGKLVIELYGKDRVIGGELYREDEGLCCPSVFTRAYYKWTGEKFQQQSKVEVLRNPEGNAIVLMPEFPLMK